MVTVRDGSVYVIARVFSEYWNLYATNVLRTPTPAAITKALQGLTVGEQKLKFRDRRATFKILDSELIDYWGVLHQFFEPGDFHDLLDRHRLQAV
jgi:hypothetical protein